MFTIPGSGRAMTVSAIVSCLQAWQDLVSWDPALARSSAILRARSSLGLGISAAGSAPLPLRSPAKRSTC